MCLHVAQESYRKKQLGKVISGWKKILYRKLSTKRRKRSKKLFRKEKTFFYNVCKHLRAINRIKQNEIFWTEREENLTFLIYEIVAISKILWNSFSIGVSYTKEIYTEGTRFLFLHNREKYSFHNSFLIQFSR